MTAPQVQNPALSVLLPVYNGERELQTTVDAIQRQTFGDFELLMLDDGSRDNSWSLMQEMAGADTRIRLFQHNPNAGIVAALNHLAAEARGQILVREDCGDFSAPDRYQLQYDALQKKPSATASVTAYWLLEEDGTVIGVQCIPSTSSAVADQLRISNVFSHATLAMRRSAFERAGGYNSEARHVEDYDLLIKLSSFGPIIPIDRPVAARHYNSAGLTFRNFRTQAAYTARMRAVHFGGASPDRLDYPALSPVEAHAEYLKLMGRMHLVKGRPALARTRFEEAAKVAPSPELKRLLRLSRIPAPIIKAARVLKGTPPDPDPFF